MMNDRVFTELLNKYLAGQINAEEWDQLSRGIKDGIADDLIIARIEEEWEHGAVDRDMPAERYYAMKNKILYAKRKSRILWLAAASVALLLCAGYFLTKQPATKPIAKQMVAVPTKRVLLPDGSTVLLRENSRLEYKKDYNNTTREVELWGEGYFDVKDVPSRPFSVKAGTVTTLVLGTVFNIKAYPGQQDVVVTVVRGKVKVGDYGILTGNQQLAVNTASRATTRANVNSTIITAWKDPYLVLDDVSMEEAAIIIGNKYHVNVLLANEGLKKCRISGTFFNNQPLEKVLDIVCAVINASYTIHPDNQVIIKGDGCR